MWMRCFTVMSAFLLCAFVSGDIEGVQMLSDTSASKGKAAAAMKALEQSRSAVAKAADVITKDKATVQALEVTFNAAKVSNSNAAGAVTRQKGVETGLKQEVEKEKKTIPKKQGAVKTADTAVKTSAKKVDDAKGKFKGIEATEKSLPNNVAHSYKYYQSKSTLDTATQVNSQAKVLAATAKTDTDIASKTLITTEGTLKKALVRQKALAATQVKTKAAEKVASTKLKDGKAKLEAAKVKQIELEKKVAAADVAEKKAYKEQQTAMKKAYSVKAAAQTKSMLDQAAKASAVASKKPSTTASKKP